MNSVNRIEVCAGWLENDPVIGCCYIDRARGSEVISFEFQKQWLVQHPGLLLDPELLNMTGRQYPVKGKYCFGFLSDSAPDRWGRKLMERREMIDAVHEKRTKRKLLESDYILGVHDRGRIGGLRFRNCAGAFLSDRAELEAPPMTELRKLEHASLELEEKRGNEEEWIRTLIAPGSSLGGARPKANVVDADGSIWIAKFPSRRDGINTGAWEMVAHELAVKCGLNVPEAKIMNVSDYGSIFLSKRFDRIPGETEMKRVHFASAMTMLGEQDESGEQHSYLELLSFLEENSGSAEKDCKELWRRIVFNICITNADDHLRNHGFLLQDNMWRLSPAYDMNPAYDQSQLSLAVNFEDPSRNIDNAIQVADYFRFGKEEAKMEVQTIRTTINKQWRYLAKKYGVPKAEQDLMAPAFQASYTE